MRASRLAQLAAAMAAIFVWSGPVVAQQPETEGSVALITSASATVKMVDPKSRIIVLVTPEGELRAIKCGKSVERFNEIKVGDQVRAMALERVAVVVGKDETGSEETAAIIARAPKSARPGVLVAESEVVTARVAAVDAAKDTVTLEETDGEQTPIKVSADVDLSKIKQGDEITVRVTKGLALFVQSPQDSASPAGAVLAPQGADGNSGLDAFDSTTTRTATVSAIDKERRTVTLKGDSGFIWRVRVGKWAINFDQVEVGDKVRTMLVEEIATAVTKSDVLPDATDGTYVARAPQGAKPGVLIADTRSLKAKIQSIDAEKRTISVAEGEGEPRTIRVAPKVDLKQLAVGDEIIARVTQSLAILVEKP